MYLVYHLQNTQAETCTMQQLKGWDGAIETIEYTYK